MHARALAQIQARHRSSVVSSIYQITKTVTQTTLLYILLAIWRTLQAIRGLFVACESTRFAQHQEEIRKHNAIMAEINVLQEQRGTIDDEEWKGRINAKYEELRRILEKNIAFVPEQGPLAYVKMYGFFGAIRYGLTGKTPATRRRLNKSRRLVAGDGPPVYISVPGGRPSRPPGGIVFPVLPGTRRPKLAWTFYAEEQESGSLKENPGVSGENFEELMEERWKKLSAEERRPYEQLAKVDYNECRVYNNALQSKALDERLKRIRVEQVEKKNG